MVFPANIVFNFHSGFSITTIFLLLNVYLMQNMKKIPLKYQFLCCFFSQRWTYFGPNFAPKTTPILLSLTDFQWNMLEDTINFNNLCWNLAVLKRSWQKLLKIVFLDPICIEKGSLWTTPKMKKHFFGRKNKNRSSAFRKSLFYPNIICFNWVINLEWCFLSKKYHFQLKQLWTGPELLEGVAGKEGVTLIRQGLQFSHKIKLKSDIFNDKKSL